MRRAVKDKKKSIKVRTEKAVGNKRLHACSKGQVHVPIRKR
jgi:hypothetical protein